MLLNRNWPNLDDSQSAYSVHAGLNGPQSRMQPLVLHPTHPATHIDDPPLFREQGCPMKARILHYMKEPATNEPTLSVRASSSFLKKSTIARADGRADASVDQHCVISLQRASVMSGFESRYGMLCPSGIFRKTV